MTINPTGSTSSVIWPSASNDAESFPFDASVPSTPVNPLQETVPGYYEKLMNMVYWLQNHPSNIKGGQEFIEYLINLSNAGKLDPNSQDPYVLAMLQQLNTPDIAALIRTTLTFEGDLSWFQDGGNNQTVKDELLEKIIAATGGRPNDPTAPDAGYPNAIMRMINNIAQGYESSLDSFATAHKDANGNLIWTQYGATYTWSNQQSMILKILGGLAGQEDAGFDAAKFMATARVNIIDQLIQQFKNDPVAAITVFLLTAYDNVFQTQLGGFAASINFLTDTINNHMTPLSERAKQIGSFVNPADAVDFLQSEQDLSVLINVNPITAQLAPTWNTGVDQAIGGISIADPNPSTSPSPGAVLIPNSNPAKYTITISQLWAGYKANTYNAAQVMDALNSLASTGTAPPTAGYTAIINAIQQGAQLLTGQSKTTETAAASVTNLDSQVINVLNAMVSSSAKGGIGFVALNDAIIKNQIVA